MSNEMTDGDSGLDTDAPDVSAGPVEVWINGVKVAVNSIDVERTVTREYLSRPDGCYTREETTIILYPVSDQSGRGSLAAALDAEPNGEHGIIATPSVGPTIEETGLTYAPLRGTHQLHRWSEESRHEGDDETEGRDD